MIKFMYYFHKQEAGDSRNSLAKLDIPVMEVYNGDTI